MRCIFYQNLVRCKFGLAVVHGLGPRVVRVERTQRGGDNLAQVKLDLVQQASVIELWQEFFDQKSMEARLVRQVDKLEMALQADLYEKLGYDDLDEFYGYCDGLIDMPEVKEIIQQLKK